MGGHGGLNILPQKSWNVYGTKQRARVRRDEENARLEAEANAAEARDEARDERWRALRESGSRPREERVHLFEAEERAAMRAEERTRRGEDAGTREDAGDAFGGRGVGRNAVKPWYARARGVRRSWRSKVHRFPRARVDDGRRRRRFARRRDASGWRAPTAAHPSASREGPIGAKRRRESAKNERKDDETQKMTMVTRSIGCGESDWSARERRQNANARFWRETNASSIGITGARAGGGERVRFGGLV